MANPAGSRATAPRPRGSASAAPASRRGRRGPQSPSPAPAPRPWRRGACRGRKRRVAARSPGFFAGLMDYLVSDEELLVAFAGEIGADPESVMAARHLLSPTEFPD